MSHIATAWAFKQKLPVDLKLPLIILANKHDEIVGKCVFSLTRLAKDCGMSRAAIVVSLAKLEKSGFIKSDPSWAKDGYSIALLAIPDWPKNGEL